MNKKCKACGVEKPATKDFFRIEPKCKDGFRSPCLSCIKIAKKDYRNSEKGRVKISEYREEWNNENPDYFKRWRASNPKYAKEWSEKNPGKAYENFKRWLFERLTDEDRAAYRRQHAHRKRARRLNAKGRFGRADVKRILSGQKMRCWWCDCKLEKYHLDHRIPLSRGGTNDPSNLVASCPPCNQKKSSKMPWEMRSNPRLL